MWYLYVVGISQDEDVVKVFKWQNHELQRFPTVFNLPPGTQ